MNHVNCWALLTCCSVVEKHWFPFKSPVSHYVLSVILSNRGVKQLTLLLSLSHILIHNSLSAEFTRLKNLTFCKVNELSFYRKENFESYGTSNLGWQIIFESLIKMKMSLLLLPDNLHKITNPQRSYLWILAPKLKQFAIFRCHSLKAPIT